MRIEDILIKTSEHTGVTIDNILSRKRDRRTSEARQIFMCIASRERFTHEEISKRLNRSRSSITTQVNQLNAQMIIYHSINTVVDKIRSKIT